MLLLPPSSTLTLFLFSIHSLYFCAKSEEAMVGERGSESTKGQEILSLCHLLFLSLCVFFLSLNTTCLPPPLHHSSSRPLTMSIVPCESFLVFCLLTPYVLFFLIDDEDGSLTLFFIFQFVVAWNTRAKKKKKSFFSSPQISSLSSSGANWLAGFGHYFFFASGDVLD